MTLTFTIPAGKRYAREWYNKLRVWALLLWAWVSGAKALRVTFAIDGGWYELNGLNDHEQKIFGLTPFPYLHHRNSKRLTVVPRDRFSGFDVFYYDYQNGNKPAYIGRDLLRKAETVKLFHENETLWLLKGKPDSTHKIQVDCSKWRGPLLPLFPFVEFDEREGATVKTIVTLNLKLI